MNREIRFRTFCEKHNQWEYYTLGDLICGYTTEANGEGGIFKSQTWSQYTGLQDKNEKDIYEGDLVKASQPNSYLGSNKSDIYEVVYHLEYACFCFRVFDSDNKAIIGWIMNNRGNHPYFITPKRTEVVGNVYEKKGIESLI